MMTNNLKLRMEYDPYQQKISYHIYENEGRQWQELAAENDLKKAKYQSTPLQNVVDDVIAIMIEKFSYNGHFDLVFIGTDEDFLTLEDSVRHNPAAQKFINLCKDEQSWYTSAAKVSEQIDEILQELEDEFNQSQDEQILDGNAQLDRNNILVILNKADSDASEDCLTTIVIRKIFIKLLNTL